MTTTIRRNSLARHQGGQAIILAIFMLCMMAVGTYTSYNIGRSVAEKIRLQNIADTTAYSMAVSEARTMNFIAFANRSMIAHYSTMMSVQALVSYLSFSQAMMGFFSDVCATIASLCRLIKNALYIAYILFWLIGMIRGVQSALEGIASAMEGIHTATESVFNIFGRLMDAIDLVTGGFTWLLIILNWLYWGASWAMSLSSMTLVADDGWTFVKKNDPNLQMKGINAALGIYNAHRFNQAFDTVGGRPLPADIGGGRGEFQFELAYPMLLPSKKVQLGESGSITTKKKIKEAQVVMTELVNASRYDVFVLDRGLGSALASNIQAIDRDIQTIQDKKNKSGKSKFKKAFDKLGSFLGGLGDFAQGFRAIFDVKAGTSMLVTDAQPRNDSQIISEGLQRAKLGDVKKSKFSYGTAMSSYDSISLWGWNLNPFTYGIYSSVSGSYHCRVDTNVRDRLDCGWLDFAKNLIQVGHWIGLGKDINKCKNGGSEKFAHPWFGIQPYMKFNPNSEDPEYNQPDVLVWLTKSKDSMKLENAPGGNNVKDLELSVVADGQTATFKGEIGEKRMLDIGDLIDIDGFNAIARGQTYYHRPGTWREHPNLFNPYWRARLAPVGEGLKDILDRLNINSGKIGDLLEKNLLPH